MEVRIKIEPETHMIGLNMQYIPYDNTVQHQNLSSNGVEPICQQQYPANGYDSQQGHNQHQNPDERLCCSAYDQCWSEEQLDLNQTYEYQEPDENFISIDDAKVRSFLLDLLEKEKEKKEEEEKLMKKKEEERMESENVLKVEGKEDNYEKSVDMSVDGAEPPTNESDESNLNDIDRDESDVVHLESDYEYIDENEEGIELNWIDLEQKTQKQVIECFLCGRSVVSSYNLRRHMMIHTGERPHSCDMCFKRFRELSDLKKHRRVHSTQTEFKCMVCHVNEPSSYDATKCIECDKNLPSDGVQQITERLLDNVSYAGPSIVAGGKKQFPCPMCNRIFGTRHNLKRHFMIHTGEKPFSCTICQKPFREVSTLKKHMLTHTKVKVYKCGQCAEQFTDYDTYVEHKETHPKKASAIKRSRGLKGHMIPPKRRRSDTESAIADDEEFECPECGDKSPSIEQYADHIKTHDSSLEFQCYICKDMFESRDLLVSHFSLHDTEDESSADG